MKKAIGALLSITLACCLCISALAANNEGAPENSISTKVISDNSVVFSLQTTNEIKAVINRLAPAMAISDEFDTPKNMILVDENNYVVGEIHADGYVVSYEYADGKLCRIVDTLGNKTEFDHTSGDLTERTYYNNQLVSKISATTASLPEEIEICSVTPENYMVNNRNMSNIMTNDEFINQSMTQAEIQSFFEEKGSMLQYEIAIFYLDNGEVTSNNEYILPARQIHYAASTYGVNPKVVICTIQKESSIVTQTAGVSSRRLYYCMGYGATDDGDYDQYSGIDVQILCGTRRLKELYDESNWNSTRTINNGQTVTSGGVTYPSTITPANQATHALYRYTPWVFDTSLLPTIGGGNYLFCQVKDSFWTSWT